MAKYKEDLTGQTFGYLTVLGHTKAQDGRACWLCRCVCGKEKQVTSHELKSGKVKSCGCRQYEKGHHRRDLTGQRFGRLEALYPTGQRDSKGSVYWHCRCDCGAELDVSAGSLTGGNQQSCGCLKRENQQSLREKLHRVDGTCVEILEKRKHRCDNKSGFRGVYRTKSGNYRVSIGFQRKRFYMGTYEDFDEAVQVRLEAEHALHDGFVKAWYEWKEKADADPEWGKANPLRFEIGKEEAAPGRG